MQRQIIEMTGKLCINQNDIVSDNGVENQPVLPSITKK